MGRGREHIVRAHQYSQTGGIVTGSDGRTVARIMCVKCEKYGHYPDFCSENVQEGATHHIITEELIEEHTDVTNKECKDAHPEEDEVAQANEEAEDVQDNAWGDMVNTWG